MEKSLFRTYLEDIQRNEVRITCREETDGKRQPYKRWDIVYNGLEGELKFNRKGSEVDQFEIEWDNDVPEDWENVEEAINEYADKVQALKDGKKLYIRV